MNDASAIHFLVTQLAAKICAETLLLLDKYDPSFFDQPLSETFSMALQYRISKATTDFLRENGDFSA